MTQQQKDTLRDLTQHFSVDHGVDDAERGNDTIVSHHHNGNGVENPRKRKRSDKTPPRHPWDQFLSLESLSLAPAFGQHLKKYGANPKKFISDNGLLKNRVPEFTSETVGDAFMACYEYTLRLESRRTKDNLRWCFTMLMCFDLVKLIKPNGSGRVGCLMQKEVNKFLGPVLGATTIQPELALKQLNEWSRCGMKLDMLCNEFGPGCLFFLGELLTQDLYGSPFL